MNGISSPGLGSGLDVNSIVTQLVALERRPLQNLQQAAQKMQTQVSSLGQLQNLVSQLKDASSQLTKADSFKAMSVSSSDSTVASASTTGSGNLAAGALSLTVSALAAAQTNAGAPGQFATASDLVGAGTLTLRVGRWATDLSGFTPKTGSVDVAITVTASDTLATLRDKINATNAGVSASIVNDASGSRLSIRSGGSGADNGFRLIAADDDSNNTDAAGLSRLAYNPPGGATQLGRSLAAADAQATVNGIAVTSASNELNGIIEGLNITLNKVSASPLSLNVSPNNELYKAKINTFVSVFNAAAKFLSDQTRYDDQSKRAGLFQGDSTVLSLYNQLRQLVAASSSASSSFDSMNSMGLERQRDGSITVNATRLDTALKNLPEMAKAFGADGSTGVASDGFARRLQEWSDGLLAASGALPSRTKTLQDRLRSNERDQGRVNDRAAQVESRLRAQYTALDRSMAGFNSLSSFVTQQLAQFNNNSNAR